MAVHSMRADTERTRATPMILTLACVGSCGAISTAAWIHPGIDKPLGKVACKATKDRNKSGSAELPDDGHRSQNQKRRLPVRSPRQPRFVSGHCRTRTFQCDHAAIYVTLGKTWRHKRSRGHVESGGITNGDAYRRSCSLWPPCVP